MGRLMAAADDLAEVAARASGAEAVARSAKWLDRRAIDRLATDASRALDIERATLGGSELSAVAASADWQRRLRDRTESSPPEPRLSEDGSTSDEATAVAIRTEADAAAAVAVARIALGEASLAVLRARLAVVETGDTDQVAAAVRGYVPLVGATLVARHGRALRTGLRAELAHVVRHRPRPLAVRLGISLALGLAYLGFLRLYRWDVKEEFLPYLALFALSGVVGSVVCTNAMSMDAARVRAALSGGVRLWHLLLVKNLVLLILVGTAGLLLSLLLAWRSGDVDALVVAFGLLFTMILLWLGAGNILSVVLPVRDEPIRERRQDKTLLPFLTAFVISYAVGYLVNTVLYWRIWATQIAVHEFGRLWLPVLTTVSVAAVMWLLLTVLAVELADQPRCRRLLLRELLASRAGKGRGAAADPPAGEIPRSP
jgi:hypothetical protein